MAGENLSFYLVFLIFLEQLLHFKTVSRVGRKMGLWLRALTALPVNPGLIPSTHMHLMAVCYSSSRASGTVTQTDIQVKH